MQPAPTIPDCAINTLVPAGAKTTGKLKNAFFFSSRRRHTRYWRDWSSDVCSSDLLGQLEAAGNEVLKQLACIELMDDGVHGDAIAWHKRVAALHGDATGMIFW